MRPTAALQSVRKHLPSKQMLADSSFFGEGGDVEELFTTPSKNFFGSASIWVIDMFLHVLA